MIYFSSFLITISLYFLELSLLPHFISWSPMPLLVLPFLSILGLKDRTIFPIILAGIMGIITDSVSGNVIPVFSIAYVLVTLISKIFQAQFLSYGEMRAYMINISLALFIIFGTDFALKIQGLHGFSWVLPLGLSIIITYVLLILYTFLGRKYFSWIEKETEERFR